MNRQKRLLALILLSAVTNVSAGLPLPQLLSTDPVQPRANQSFDFVYSLAACGDTFPGSTSQNRTIELIGNTLRVTALYSGELCFPLQPYQPFYRWRIDPLPAGTYEMELWGYNNGPQNAFPIAVGEVTIAPALVAPKPNVVPAAGKFGLLSLSLLTALAAMWGLRRR